MVYFRICSYTIPHRLGENRRNAKGENGAYNYSIQKGIPHEPVALQIK